MLPAQDLQYRRLACAVGADEEAALTGVEGEADVLNERRRARRGPAVDARVGEGEIPDLHRWRHGAWLPAVAGPPEVQAELGNCVFWLVERRAEAAAELDVYNQHRRTKHVSVPLVTSPTNTTFHATKIPATPTSNGW